MKDSSYIVLKALLNQPHLSQNLGKYLMDSEKKRLSEISLSKAFDLNKFDTPQVLNKIHYSWFIPTLNSIDERQDSFILISALNPSLQDKLNQSLQIHQQPEPISIAAREYIHLILLASLVGEDDTLLPIDYLPTSDMNILLELSKSELMYLIDCLALYDLAIELKKIVDTETIKSISSYLTPLQRRFLTKIRTYHEPFSFPSLLKDWDNTKEGFYKLLHKRGLHRLAIALCTSHKDLIWYICHFLDTGRGNTLIKLCEKKANDKTITTIQSHIFEIVNLIKENS